METPPIGPVKVVTPDLQELIHVLKLEGFTNTILQVRKEGQVFGMIKRVAGDLEIHVRGFDDCTLDSEIELSRKYLQHPHECKPCYGPILHILRKHNVPYLILRPIPDDPLTIHVPRRKTAWAPLLIGGTVATAFLGVFLRKRS